MNTLKCWALMLTAGCLLPSLAAGADAAKKACDNGLFCLEKQDYDGAISAFTETLRLDPKNADAYYHRVGPTRAQRTSTRQSPISRSPFASTRNMPRGTWAWARPTTPSNNLGRAISNFTIAIELDPSLVKAYNVRAPPMS